MNDASDAPRVSRPPLLPGASAQDLLTVAEVAAQLRVSKMTVYRLVNSGELDGMRIGRSIRVTRGSVRALLAGAEEPPAG